MKRLLVSSFLVTALIAAGVYFYVMLPDVSVLKKNNPRSSALMELRDAEYKKKAIRVARQQTWVSYSAISEHLKKAVLVSEDSAFFSHKGIDLVELREALKRDWATGSFVRGGSTITM